MLIPHTRSGLQMSRATLAAARVAAYALSLSNDLAEHARVGDRHRARLRGDPCAQAVGGVAHSFKRRAAQVMMHHRGGESVARADRVNDVRAESGVLEGFCVGDEQAAAL